MMLGGLQTSVAENSALAKSDDIAMSANFFINYFSVFLVASSYVCAGLKLGRFLNLMCLAPQ